MDAYMDWLTPRYGFTVENFVALMGAHTLGAAHASATGFSGPWVPDTEEFNNEYYKHLKGFDIPYSAHDQSGKQFEHWNMEEITEIHKFQWRKCGLLNPANQSQCFFDLIMLNVDMVCHLNIERIFYTFYER